MKQKLSEIANITMGQSPLSSCYNSDGIGTPFLQGCTTFGRIYPSYDTWTTQFNKSANENDVLFTVRAPVGDVNLCQRFTAIGRGLASIHATKVSQKYLFYLLEGNKSAFTSASSGTIYQSINKDKLCNVVLNVHDSSTQQHIVDTIGSVDSFIEFNQEKISKIKSLATQKYEFLYKVYPKSAIGKRLKFIKGKQPKFVSKEEGLPYLVIDDLASNIYTQFSSEGLACDENDVLMVMDGASSGKVFTGNKGYVGSTLAKLSSSQIKSSILYFGLSKFEEEIMKNTTGSAIPHTDKSFVCELQIIDDLDGKTTDFFDFCLNQICNLRTQNSLLNIQKEILLQKFFH